MRIKALLAAVVAFALFLALGARVSGHGEPTIFAAWEASIVNHSTLIAWWLTWACYPKLLIPVGVILLLLAWRLPAWRARMIFSVVMLLLCWRGADLFQHVFARPRRLDWVVKQEHSFSYPSSHAAIAVGFYALWAVLLYMSELPRATRNVAAAALAILTVAIGWSRLALGAHYVTDLIGGALLAIALVSAGAAVVPGVFGAAVAGRTSVTAE